MVLYSSMLNGYYFISIIAIIVSVISASYYLKIIHVIYFQKSDNIINNYTITNIHSFLIATFTIIITLFVIQPSIILNSTTLIALSMFYYL